METNAYIFAPAGGRIMAGDPQGRIELIARQDWGKTKEAEIAREAGIGFGFELKGAPKGFDPKMLNGLPYSIHAPNEILTQLYKAETDKDEKSVQNFWDQISAWAKLSPKPIYVVFHGGGLGDAPPINKHRFELTIEPGEWLARAKWHEKVFNRLREIGLTQAALETVYLSNYYGPPYAKGWLPITYFSPRVGIYKDMLSTTKAAGVGSIVDLEHLQMTCQSLMLDSPELAEVIRDVGIYSLAPYKPGSEFQEYFGFCVEKGKIPTTGTGHLADWVRMWEAMVSLLHTSYYHVGGISETQVVEITEAEANASGYHKELIDYYKSDPYAMSVIRCRRGGSHASVKYGDSKLRHLLGHALRVSSDLSEPTILVLETTNKGEVNPDYWYWSRPDALESSLTELRKMLPELI